jgi:aldehyde:ferredoxin oxidoreductase
MMSFGYYGKIIYIDLTDSKITIEEKPDSFYRKYLGGYAMGAYYLLRDMDPATDPLDPESIIAFAPGVTTGAPIGGLSRYAVVAKSPESGRLMTSEAGGYWGAELKFAGFDAVIIKGKAKKPVYIWIENENVEVRDAEGIWGSYTADATEKIRDIHGKRARVVVIGTAGENLVKYACITNESKHFNGRGGLGAVMGSKNLKAIAVKGNKKVPVSNPEVVKLKARRLGKDFIGNGEFEFFHDLGTAPYLSFQNETGQLPTRNFHTGVFENADDISGSRIIKLPEYKGHGACYACPIRCKIEVESKGDFELDIRYGGPEYETVAMLGSCLCIKDIYKILKANELCNKYGLDTVSVGGSIAFAMECYENGLITKEDTGSLDLRFGNGDAMLELIPMINEKKGFGKILAEGSREASRHIGRGSEKYAMHVKGVEIPGHEPRVKQAYGLSFATTTKGADHMSLVGDPVVAMDAGESSLNMVRPMGISKRMELSDISKEKVRYVYYGQMLMNMMDSLCICQYCFMPHFFTLKDLEEIIEAVTGWNISLWELMKVGDRCITMSRMFNIAAGLKKEEDWLPERMFEPLESGSTRGKKIDRDNFKKSISLLYGMYGWDEESGIPGGAKIEELELSKSSL